MRHALERASEKCMQYTVGYSVIKPLTRRWGVRPTVDNKDRHNN